MKRVELNEDQAQQLEKMLGEVVDRENQKLDNGQDVDWGNVGLANYLRTELKG